MMEMKIHWLSYRLHEDEAMKTGKGFCPRQDGRVDVWTTFSGYPESEQSSLEILSLTDARALYRKLLDEEKQAIHHPGTESAWAATDSSPSSEGCHPRSQEHGMKAYEMRAKYERMISRGW